MKLKKNVLTVSILIGLIPTTVMGALTFNSNNIEGSGAMTLQPADGSNLNVILSDTGDLAVNTDQLYVDTSSGYVGIGTTSPVGGLSIINTTGGNTVSKDWDASTVLDLMSSAGGTNSPRLVFTVDNNSPYTSSIQARHPDVSGQAYPIALNPLGGYVGIGTSNPGAELDVQGGVNLEKGTGTIADDLVTIDKTSGVITDSKDINADTTRAAITLTNSRITTTSVVVASLCSVPDAGTRLGVSIAPGNGNAVITVYNAGGLAQTSDYKICFIVTN